jgi:hypothetical protein
MISATRAIDARVANGGSSRSDNRPTDPAMKRLSTLVLFVAAAAALPACDGGARQQLRDLAHADSLRSDSLLRIKDEMLNEVMASTQFVNDLNTEIASLRTPLKSTLSTAHQAESQSSRIQADREEVRAHVHELVARLDSSEKRMSSLRARAAELSRHDVELTEQVARYEQTIVDLRNAAERQRSELQSIINEQSTKIVALNSRIDTVTRENVQLAGARDALSDTVSQLTTLRNSVFYVIGTRDELLKKGVLVEEGHRPVLGLFGSKRVEPARDLDPAQFVRIDRLRDREIALPEGEYSIVSRQDLSYATPETLRDNRISGSLNVDRPEKFWEPSSFLVLLRH